MKHTYRTAGRPADATAGATAETEGATKTAARTAPGPGALSHLRVLDLSRVLAGPWCTQNLADMGADVIKVERPGAGDDTRGWGPPWTRDPSGAPGDSTYYASANRGKKSITVNIASPQGQALLRQLVAQCDVLVENYKVGDLRRYGLDYDSLSAIHPGLVYCSITGYGQDGPHAHKPGYDFVFQAIGGLMSITGERDDLPGGGPQKAGVAIADIMTGMYATIAILSALQYRTVSGRGQYIDMALLDCLVALGGNQVTGFFATGKAPPRYGNAHASLVPYQVFDAQDGRIVVAVGNDTQWQQYCLAIDRPDLGQDARWNTVKGRVTGRDVLVPELEKNMRTRPAADWVARLEAHGVPCGRINDYAQVFDDPQVRHRGLRVDVPTSAGGKTGSGSISTVATIASPLRLRATPPVVGRAPPALGADTEDVLRDVLGCSAQDIARYRQAGVI